MRGNRKASYVAVVQHELSIVEAPPTHPRPSLASLTFWMVELHSTFRWTR
jgi:hypothetical protein